MNNLEMTKVVVMGKIESGTICEMDNLLIMPKQVYVKVVAIYCYGHKVRCAGPGDIVRVKLTGIEREDILCGSVLSSTMIPIASVTEFDAQLLILDLPDNAIFSAGYKAMLHIHAIVEECEITDLMQQLDKKTKKCIKDKVRFVSNGALVNCRIQVSKLICIEKFADFPQMGRVVIRNEDRTIAVGKIMKLPNA